MYLEIVSPERTLFNGDVESVLVPGTDGSFQMLDNHAPIVSTLIKGTVKILGEISVSDDLSDVFSNVSSNETHLSISSGVVEMKENKIIFQFEIQKSTFDLMKGLSCKCNATGEDFPNPNHIQICDSLGKYSIDGSGGKSGGDGPFALTNSCFSCSTYI